MNDSGPHITGGDGTSLTDRASAFASGGSPVTNGQMPPSLTLPKGGGAIRGVGEKFSATPVTGTAGLQIPLPLSPGRAGFTPPLSLSYDSGAGNGPFGLGWKLDVMSITRKTDKGVPRYLDEPEDVYVLAGTEDLVPVLELTEQGWRRWEERRDVDGREIRLHRYRPRVEGTFARIERWTDPLTQEQWWCMTTKDNITTRLGATPASRVADPEDPTRVFTWLASATWDDAGNAAVYEYKAEDSDAVDHGAPCEQNRTPLSRSAHRYLKRVRYGNLVSHLLDPAVLDARDPNAWMFELVFDYGEHPGTSPEREETGRWLCRRDPFSTYRSGFEIRCYRLCRRMLMYHNMPGKTGLGEGTLVRSTTLEYQDDKERGGLVMSLLAGVTVTGHRLQDGRLRSASLPSIELGYTQPVIDPRVHDIEPDALSAPLNFDRRSTRWIDLDRCGLAGFLRQEGNAWLFSRGLGEARFGPAETLPSVPVGASLSRGGVELLDLDGDGGLDLVDFDTPTPTIAKAKDGGGWLPFAPVEQAPNLSWGLPNVRLIDLSGDGLADVLVLEDTELTSYASLGARGFALGYSNSLALDEERGLPRVGDDSQGGVFLADMSGDGLVDVVRVRNGEICYWPALGHGRFGPRVLLGDAPWFDNPDRFDVARLRVADVDGSGTTDIVYLHHDGARLYANRAGNSFGPPVQLGGSFPTAESTAAVEVLDLLGVGTACLVWSSPLPGEARPLRYIRLMSSGKPYLLKTVVNNVGGETHIKYAPSTSFSLAAREAGRPWATPLPFPVHVVEQVETLNRITDSRFVTRYAYHDGFYDGVEREFRGFGLVERWDAEEYSLVTRVQERAAGSSTGAPSTHLPPVLTRSWYHTGATDIDGQVSQRLAQEYWNAGLDPRPANIELPATVRLVGGDRLAHVLTDTEAREARRALKGSLLREEVYGLDGSQSQERPYVVTEHTYTVELLQPSDSGPHAVFFVHSRETVTATYERATYLVAGHQVTDPRVTHAFVLDVDAYGTVLRSAEAAYGRRHADPFPDLSDDDRAKAAQTHVTWTDNHVTNAVDTPRTWRTPAPARSRRWEARNLTPRDARFRPDEIADALRALSGQGATELCYGDWQASSASEPPARRLLSDERVRYRRDDLRGALPFGVLESKGLPFETERLAFPTGLLDTLYGDRLSTEILSDLGFREDGDGWWAPSGRIHYSPPEIAVYPASELAYANAHFYIARLFIDSFGNPGTVTYDDEDLLVREITDVLGNRITAGERAADGTLLMDGNDYRVLAPWLLSDPNGNRTAVAFDTRGIVVGTAVMGKPEEPLGDTLDGFDADLSESDVVAYFVDPLDDPGRLLQQASARSIYDVFAYQRTATAGEHRPSPTSGIRRETHIADLPTGQRSRLQQSVEYADGFGRVVQHRTVAEPERPGDADRWVVSGWTVLNNKGAPVRSYEPFFSGSHAFEIDAARGVSNELCYDSVGRVVATLYPDGTWGMTRYEPWRQEAWDGSDTVLSDPRDDPFVGGLVRAVVDASTAWRPWYDQRVRRQLGADEQDAAAKSAAHAETPGLTWFDSLGHGTVTAAHNRTTSGADEWMFTRTSVDVEGIPHEVRDAMGRVVARYAYAMGGIRACQASLDAGERRLLPDAKGATAYVWSARGFRQRLERDALRRPVRSWIAGLREDDRKAEVLAERTDYGEAAVDAEARNLRLRPQSKRDASGITENERFDVKGNLIHARRRLAADYKSVPDWSTDVLLEDEVFESKSRYDALSRPTMTRGPDGSELRPSYDRSGLLRALDGSIFGNDTSLLADIAYDARGQRVYAKHGNGAESTYTYDPFTFRLRLIRTIRRTTILQALRYTFDAVGNVTMTRDAAQADVFFRNRRIAGRAEYSYDATYRLVSATGREHIANAMNGYERPDQPHLPVPTDGSALSRFSERYDYDLAGNLLGLAHRSADRAAGGWTLRYGYEEESLLELGKVSNRLSWTRHGHAPVLKLGYDASGNITHLPDVALMRWNHEEQLQSTARQIADAGTPEITYYVYDATGQRIRKVTERASDQREGATRKSERIYLGTFELYREWSVAGKLSLERESLHILDGTRRAAIAERRTVGSDEGAPQLLRYQLSNHLGSTMIELDETARVISAEEYYPYGGTAYRAARSRTETPKRYRYSGKERDRETGLDYFGARYYVSWLGRWASCDPVGQVDSNVAYAYVRDNPVRLRDPDGAAESEGWTRFWGGVQMVGGGLQLAGGALGLLAPEPTGLTKVLGVVAIVHGTDDFLTGARQMLSGSRQRNLTEAATTAAAEGLGADHGTAQAIGQGVNLAAGFAVPIGSGPAVMGGGARVLVGGGIEARTVIATAETVNAVHGASTVLHAGMTTHVLLSQAQAGDPASDTGSSGAGSGSAGGTPSNAGDPSLTGPSGPQGGGGTGPPLSDAAIANLSERLIDIARHGGPLPQETRGVGGAIIRVPSWPGPKELRALSAGATDALGEGAAIPHAPTPSTRNLSAARMIGGRGGGAPVSHINDVEIKIYEYLRANGLSRDAQGSIYIGTWRTRAGGTIFEPLPMCASCSNATFQMVGDFPGITFGSLTSPNPGQVLDIEAMLLAALKAH